MITPESRILIAEDSPTQRAQLVGFLTRLGYAVTATAGGGEAYAEALANPPDIIVSDILMPEVNGYELCQRLKATPGLEDVPVILVTSLSQPQDVLAGLEAGADSFIIKPYDEQVLSSRITYLLQNRTLRRTEQSGEPLEVEIGGTRHQVTARRQQILDLLISTYAQAVHLFSALDRGRQELSQSYDVLRALYDMTEGLNRCHTPQDISAMAVVRSLGIPGVRDAWLYLRGEADDGLRLAAHHHHGRSGPRPDPFPPGPDDLVDPPGPPAAAVPAVREFAPAWGHGALWHHARVPLRNGRRTVGFLQLTGVDVAISNEMALRTLAGVAGQISIALERAMLHTHLENEVRRRTQRLVEEVEERRQATETITAIFNASPVALVSLDARLRLTNWNRTARDTFRIGQADRRGQPWSVLFAAPPADLEHAILALRASHAMAGLEIRAAIPDGTERVFHIDGEPLIDPGGEFRGAALAIDDITDRKQVMEQLHQAQKMEAVGNLTGGIAHDFNNLLTSIIGNLDLALLKIGPHPARGHLDVALRASLRGSELSRKLLAFARKQALEPCPIDVADMLADLRILLESTIGSRVRLSVVVPPGLPRVYADPVQLESALMNLAINARDAMPAGGALVLSVSTAPLGDPAAPGRAGVLFRVADTGTGIPPQLLERIFEPFFTTKEKGKGTGLGLAMVYGFARQSGGSVTVDSTVGAGTTFSLCLPAHDGTSGRPAPAPAGPGHPRGIHVLLIEADDEVRDTIRATLEAAGHSVHAVAGSAAALEAVDRMNHFDVVLVERTLPEEAGGLDLAQRIAGRRPGSRILLMSGEDTPTDARSAAPPAPFRVLRKPFRQEDLQAALAALLQGGAAGPDATGP